MKARLFLLIGMVSFGITYGWAEPCAYSLRTSRPQGPEVTGNYARPYLYSPDTGCWYPDPMYYVAKDALRRWHARHGGAHAPIPEKVGPVKRYQAAVEK